MSAKSNKMDKKNLLGNKKNRPKSSKETQEEEKKEERKVHCICRKYSFGNMIECEECKEWFHFGCVDIDEDNVPKEWICEECEKKLKKDKKNKKSRSKSNEKEEEDEEDEEEEKGEKKVHCICRKHSFGNMIECDQCKEWFHYECVNIDEDNVPEEWTCQECEKKLKKKKKGTKGH